MDKGGRTFWNSRAKSNMKYSVVKNRKLPCRGNVRKDQEIVLDGYYSSKKCTVTLRRVVVWDSEKEPEIVLLTNHMGFAATFVCCFWW